MTKNTLYVNSETQRIIFVYEMMGNCPMVIGENANPHNHWEPWCKAEVVVGNKVGRNFDAVKTNYNFASDSLLSVVHERIMMRVKAFLLRFDEEILSKLPDSLADYDNYQEFAAEDGASKYWQETLEELNSHGINAATMQAIEEWNGYTKEDLLRDCKALRVAAQTKLAQH